MDQTGHARLTLDRKVRDSVFPLMELALKQHFFFSNLGIIDATSKRHPSSATDIMIDYESNLQEQIEGFHQLLSTANIPFPTTLPVFLETLLLIDVGVASSVPNEQRRELFDKALVQAESLKTSNVFHESFHGSLLSFLER